MIFRLSLCFILLGCFACASAQQGQQAAAGQEVTAAKPNPATANSDQTDRLDRPSIIIPNFSGGLGGSGLGGRL